VYLRIIGSRYFTIQTGRSKKFYAISNILESVEGYLCKVGERTVVKRSMKQIKPFFYSRKA
jgi:hypothetical protein